MALKIWRGPTTALVLAPESGGVTLTDRIRSTDVYMGTYALCASNLLARGTFGSGSRAGWVVNQCSLQSLRGGIGKLSIEWEAGGTSATNPLPVGNPSLQPQELYPKVERNSYFQGTSGVTGAPTTPIEYNTIQLAYNALYTATQSGSASAKSKGDKLTGDQKKHFDKLFAKLMAGEETYYLAGWRYTYETYSYTLPTVYRGAVVETPGGPLSSVLPSGVDWLRLADNLDPAGVAGSMWKLTKNYLGGPGGHWDPDLYNGK